ncbi:ABC transporter [Rhodanobacter sp. FW510-R12]|uniref:GldG family protein n=1 Tax=unclassified Rhodanobacter TaxID=2621553 RepID=UPI0007A9AC48|nr:MULTISPECIES: GldG family protein [unclassified Rhodanobacter]KZC17443.1 ABC transporter [Rhodanobacter sp. FW104-R8]KZC27867.1 ABC transporter [Rhodanobacter sp. FW510-T8]KZC32054.1 ABC transporter [Rhodanobacter sp. FW510-R10]
MRNLFRRLDGWLFALLLVLAAGAAGYLSTRYAHQADWTANGRTSLSAESRAVLARFDGPVEIVSYANPQGDLRRTVAGFLQRYQAVKPDLGLRFVDPQLDPAKMRELGITVDGALILHYKDREQRLDELSERSLTNALERLLRGSDRIVAFVTGDGERRADGQANADLGTFMAQLEARGMRAVPLNFAQVPAVPEHTDLVVLASPTLALPPGAVQALVGYVQNGGNLLWLTEPANDDLGLGPLAAALGVRMLPGVLVDGSGAALGLHDPRLIALGDYPAQAITRGFNLTTLFPQASALAQLAQGGWAVKPFLRSGAQSWTEFRPIDNSKPSEIRYDADAGELKGPLDFGFALSRLSPSPDKSEQRAVVIGDGDFLSNTFLGNGGNRALGERVFDWLLGDDKLVQLPPRGAPDRLLEISQAGLNALSLGFLVVLPLLLLLAGGLIAWRRRRR